MRDRYGRNQFGQSCLLARRLVEAGVPFITINDGGWDTHKDNFEAMRRKLPVQDQAISALLEDLAQRGLLPETVVTWYGEFGRTPRVVNEAPWFGGRHHWAQRVFRGGGRRRLQGRTGSRLHRCARRDGARPAGLSVGPLGQHLQAAGHRPPWQTAAPAGLRGVCQSAGGKPLTEIL